jgi:hypothetical protein
VIALEKNEVFKMMIENFQKPTLTRPATYQIKVPGNLSEGWLDWGGRMTIIVERNNAGQPVTTLTGTVDQAALQGILRRLYFLGLPLISVICVDCG